MTALSIQFDGDGNQTPRVFTGSILSGLLKVSGPGTVDSSFDMVEMIFDGVVRSTIRNNFVVNGRSIKTLPVGEALVCLTDVKHMADPSDFHSVLSSDMARKDWSTSFQFTIPRCASAPTSSQYAPRIDLSEPIDTPQALPPSLHIRTTSKSSPMEPEFGNFGTCDVEYQLTAKALLQGQVVTERSWEVLVTPTAMCYPRLDVTDFPGEYRLATSSWLMNPLRLRRLGQLFVTSMEPEPMTMTIDQGSTSSGSGQVKLNFVFRQQGQHTSAKPDFLDSCEVSTQLETRTYYSVARQERVLTATRAEDSRYVGQEKWMTKEQTRKLKLPMWERQTGGQRGEADWMTSTTVAFTNQSKVVMLPTFHSSLVSRHFTLLVRAKLSSEKHRLAHSSLELKVPVQLLYPPSGGHGNGVRTSTPHAACNSGLPAYKECSAPDKREGKPPPYLSHELGGSRMHV